MQKLIYLWIPKFHSFQNNLVKKGEFSPIAMTTEVDDAPIINPSWPDTSPRQYESVKEYNFVSFKSLWLSNFDFCILLFDYPLLPATLGDPQVTYEIHGMTWHDNLTV